MADLKLGTTVGGSAVWHKGNFPLTPAGNSITYNGYKMYTANDKPQAADNDFVSKASGGQYQDVVNFDKGLQINAAGSFSDNMGLFSGPSDGASLSSYNLEIRSWYGVGFYDTCYKKVNIVFNVRTGDMTSNGTMAAYQHTSSAATPSNANHLTRKDYVDSNINNVNNNANSRVLRAGDTMTGGLTAPQFTSNNAATAAGHVPRLDQVITKGTIIDFGTF